MTLQAEVANIINDIRQTRDLAKWSAKLDDYEGPLWMAQDAWQEAAVADELEAALRRNLARIEAFHQPQLPVGYEVETAPGVVAGRRPVPLDAVACYVPGGRAAYPSTVLMTVTLARLAGVPRIVVATPPGPDGIHPAVLVAARLAGAAGILCAGGAHAVAALAYGAEGVEPVQSIVGPGNAWVTEAKRQVQADVRIDMLAGPSELAVVVDARADLTAVALDLVAQAEHDPDARVVAYVEPGLATVLERAVQEASGKAKRHSIVAASLEHFAVHEMTAADAVAAINAAAPEHVGLYHTDGEALAKAIIAAGSVFVNTPVPFGDYATGTNHVLPTGGTARLRGGLEVADFIRWITYQRTTESGRLALAADVATVARAEGLFGHAEAVE